MLLQPGASYTFILRAETSDRPGTLGRVTTVIGDEGGELGAIDIVRVRSGRMVRDLTVAARDEAHADIIVERVRLLDGVTVLHVTDRTFLVHLGGKIEVTSRVPVKGRDDLSTIYTPGVARICLAIRDDPARQWTLTVKRHMVAVVTDGSAVLGLGNIGPAAAQPVMEGKCIIFKTFGDIDAFPICLASQDPEEIVRAVRMIAPVFGGINLEDIAAPNCFLVEERLRGELDIPVMHNDQHGTAVMVLAALRNALKVVDKQIDAVRIVISGIGAAGMATARMMLAAGARNVVACDRAGALFAGRVTNMNPYKERLAAVTNPGHETGSLRDALRGADVFIGLSGPGVVTEADIATMAPDPIVFALANPLPEVQPQGLLGIARVIATARSDYPNQINNSLVFPGMFRGALDVQATDIDDSMKLAAADAIARLIRPEELTEEYIVPSMFDRRVAETVAQATRAAAWASGAARKPRPPD